MDRWEQLVPIPSADEPARDTLAELSAAILAFCDERDWRQFHSPRNVAAALAVETAELQETLLWKSDAEVITALENPNTLLLVKDELADVVIYALLFANAVGVDVASAIRDKLAKNSLKYPVDRAKGSAKKYSDPES